MLDWSGFPPKAFGSTLTCPMISRFLPLILGVAAVGSLVFAIPCRAGENGLAATVNGRPILRSEVDEMVKVQLLQARQISDPDKRAEIVSKLRTESRDRLIERELILAEYQKLSQGQPIKQQYVDEDIKTFVRETYNGDNEKFLKELKAYGMTLKKFRELREKMLVEQMMRGHLVKETGYATPEKKQQFLKEHGEMFREKDFIKLRSITIPKIGQNVTSTPQDQRKLIAEIRQRIAKGADFGALAKEHSTDSHAEAGGDWGWINDKTMSGRIADVAFSLKAKTMSEIIEDEDNFYLLYVEARQPGKAKPKEQIDADLEKLVNIAEKQKAWKAVIERMEAKANIRRFPLN